MSVCPAAVLRNYEGVIYFREEIIGLSSILQRRQDVGRSWAWLCRFCGGELRDAVTWINVDTKRSFLGQYNGWLLPCGSALCHRRLRFQNSFYLEFKETKLEEWNVGVEKYPPSSLSLVDVCS